MGLGGSTKAFLGGFSCVRPRENKPGGSGGGREPRAPGRAGGTQMFPGGGGGGGGGGTQA